MIVHNLNAKFVFACSFYINIAYLCNHSLLLFSCCVKLLILEVFAND